MMDMHSQATQDFRRYLSNQYAEPSPFLPTLPSLYPTQVKTAGHLVSRDCKMQWMVGIREDEDQE